jgi:hypothetical protein
MEPIPTIPSFTVSILISALFKKSGVAGVQELQNRRRLVGQWMGTDRPPCDEDSTRLAVDSKPVSVLATDI